MTTLHPEVAPAAPRDHMPLNGIDHLELWVGNAKQASYYLTRAFGFTETAYSGLETGARDRTSHVLEQGRIRLVLTGTLRAGTDIAEHHARHGDGVKVIALSVPDVDEAYAEATARGATGVTQPHDLSDEHGTIRTADVANATSTGSWKPLRTTTAQTAITAAAMQATMKVRMGESLRCW